MVFSFVLMVFCVLLSGRFQLPCLESSNTTTTIKPPTPSSPVPPPRSKHKRNKQLRSIVEAKSPPQGGAESSGAESGAEEKRGGEGTIFVFPDVQGQGLITGNLSGCSSARSSPGRTLEVPDPHRLLARRKSDPPAPLTPSLLTPDSCGSHGKSSSTGSVNLKGLEVSTTPLSTPLLTPPVTSPIVSPIEGPNNKLSLCKTLSDRGSEIRQEEAEDDKSALRRSSSDPEVKNKKIQQLQEPKSPSLFSRIKKRSRKQKEKKLVKEKSVCKSDKKGEGKEKGDVEKDSRKDGREKGPREDSSHEDLTAVTPGEDIEAGEEAATLDQEEVIVVDVSPGDKPDPTETRSFLRRVSIKLKAPFYGRSKTEDEDPEHRLMRERAKFQREKRIEVLDLTEDSNKKPCVRKTSIVEMCGAGRKGGTYELLNQCFCTL